MPLSKLSGGRWFGTPCGVNIMTKLQNADITNDYVSNERVLVFPLLLARICRWTNNRLAGNLKQHDAMWSHCNNNASKADFSIPNQSVWIFLLLSIMACCWANCQAGGECGRHSAHVEWLKWQCCKTRFRYYKSFLLQSKCVDVSFALSHGTLLSKLSIGRWFGTPWRSCGVTVMTML